MGPSSMGKCGDLVPWGKWTQVPQGKLVPYINLVPKDKCTQRKCDVWGIWDQNMVP